MDWFRLSLSSPGCLALSASNVISVGDLRVWTLHFLALAPHAWCPASSTLAYLLRIAPSHVWRALKGRTGLLSIRYVPHVSGLMVSSTLCCQLEPRVSRIPLRVSLFRTPASHQCRSTFLSALINFALTCAIIILLDVASGLVNYYTI